ncbi:MAG: AraC family transcriptional regulator [Thermodesulfobacteriota bacterium]
MAKGTVESYRERLNRALVLLESRLDEPASLEDLARAAHLSPYHFHRVFAGMVGEPVAAYQRRLRLERAVGQLSASARPVTDIALDAGYESHEAFTRAFKAAFGESPSAYRKRAAAGDRSLAGALRPVFPSNHGRNDMEAKIVQVPARRVAYVRHVGPYQNCGAAWGTLCAWAGPKGLLGPQTQFIGMCHDDPEITPPDKVRYDACIAAPETAVPEGAVGVQELPGGEYASTVHKGPYANLAATYNALCGQWIPAQGREMRHAPSLEIYLNCPDTTPPQDLRTEVLVPLEPAA